MKTYFKQFFAALLAVGIIFSSCSKGVDTPITPTTLQVSVTTNIGTPIAGANIEIYSNLSDYSSRSNPVATKFANPYGIAVFDKGILPIVYYVWADDNSCKLNAYSNTKTLTLTANQNNFFNTSVESVGKLTFVNNSIFPYKVYVNGTLVITSLQGLTSQSLFSLVGTYSIRVVQISGYVTTPIDKTYTGTISCGSEFVTRFP
jgi:hypothetical protein